MTTVNIHEAKTHLSKLLERVESGEPPGLYRGPVQLADGRTVPGILYPREMAEGIHSEITAFGGWREYWTTRDPG